MNVKCIEKIEKVSENVYEVDITYDNGLRDVIIIESNVDVRKLSTESIIKLVKLMNLIDEIAHNIEKDVNNVRDVYIYPSNYEIIYTIEFDGIKKLKITHNVEYDNA